MKKDEINERLEKMRQHIGDNVKYNDNDYLILDVESIGFSETQILKPNQKPNPHTNFSNSFLIKVKNLSTNEEKVIENDEVFESLLLSE